MPVAEPEAGSRVRYSGDARRTYPVSIVPRADDDDYDYDDYDYDYDDNDTIGVATHYADKAFTWTLPLYRSSTAQHYQENYSQAKRLSHICNAVQWGVILSWQASLLNVTSTRWDPLPNRQLAFLSCYGLFIMRPQSQDFLPPSAKTR
ncbi:hypothetical protein HZH66_006757 [Vespula vulgaris]|uniref:Uncharacterized protein n=1 Tax=Vespula vulgaris TaxID=7454 RepID=A0A834K2W4_VESVU|nr:hypothetical protein HZH66_006757 [Vespula vulgaris]